MELFEHLDRLTSEGFLRKVISPCEKLVLYNYTDKCTFEEKWNKYTLNARGTVYEIATGNVVARAFPKFFNFGELPTSKSRNLLKEKDFQVNEKMDGSLGIIYYYNGWKVNTRGSFTSEQAIKGLDILLSKYDQSLLNKSTTYLVEIIYPENRIIVNYGDEEKLTLLATFHTQSGNELSLDTLKWNPFPCAPTIDKFSSIPEIIEEQSKLSKLEEGFVVRFSNGERVKFKSVEYLKIARILSNMTPLNCWKVMKNGRVDKSYTEHIPEEFRDELNKIVNDLEGEYLKIKSLATIDFVNCMMRISLTKSILSSPVPAEDVTPKDLGLHLKEKNYRFSNMFFSFYKGDGEAIDRAVMKLIRPKGNELC